MNRVNMTAFSLSVTCLVGCTLLWPGALAGQESSDGREAGDGANAGATLATSSYKPAGDERQLVLWKERLPSPSPVELLAYFKKHPEANAFPNVAFLLIDSAPDKAPNGRVTWVTYTYEDPKARPALSWSGDIVSDSALRDAYVVLVRSVGSRASVRVFQADPSKNLGDYPLDFTPKKHDEWPPGAEALSPEHGISLEQRTCGVARIRTALEDGVLTVRAESTQPDCRPVQSRFDVKTKKWTGD